MALFKGKTLASDTSGTSYTLHEVVGSGSEGAVYSASVLTQTSPRTCDFTSKMSPVQGLFGSATVPMPPPQTSNHLDDSLLAIKATKSSTQMRKSIGSSELEFLRAIPAHPSVMTPTDSFEHAGHTFMVFPLAKDSLREFLNTHYKCKDREQSERTAFYIFYQMVSGLLHCHRNGVAHRDIKCENVLVHYSSGKGELGPRISVTDFGLSKFVHKGGPATADVGSPHYVAPEVVYKNLRAKNIAGGGYDPCLADVWSCGVMLHAIMFGKLPYRSMDGQTIMQLAARGDFKFSSDPASSLDDLLRKMLAPAEQRISMEGVMSHPYWVKRCAWLHLDCNGVEAPQCSPEPVVDEVAHQVLSWGTSIPGQVEQDLGSQSTVHRSSGDGSATSSRPNSGSSHVHLPRSGLRRFTKFFARRRNGSCEGL